MGQNVNINGKDYDLDSLSDKVKAQIVNLRVSEQKIAQLEQELAMIKTARATYARALNAQLPKDE